MRCLSHEALRLGRHLQPIRSAGRMVPVDGRSREGRVKSCGRHQPGFGQLYAPDCIRKIRVSTSARPSGVVMWSAGRAPPKAGHGRTSHRLVHASASNPEGSPLSSTIRCTKVARVETSLGASMLIVAL